MDIEPSQMFSKHLKPNFKNIKNIGIGIGPVKPPYGPHTAKEIVASVTKAP
jgi:hypothetical protein